MSRRGISLLTSLLMYAAATADRLVIQGNIACLAY
jgi:hypothetical protein